MGDNCFERSSFEGMLPGMVKAISGDFSDVFPVCTLGIFFMDTTLSTSAVTFGITMTKSFSEFGVSSVMASIGSVVVFSVSLLP
ncbi:hypothetical protein GDO86_016743 [Hymenochirus boettgeri]|uniref:Uncharacterized protein n=1 Tax=Hymenochirus boettgeri TaxID=247094 RepID=A0A8T2IM97_9PIPI|nr:hypothetical protein GDO86_016743 [Hymenochirus boettgeri]